MVGSALLAWLVVLVLVVGVAVLRESLLAPRAGALRAHQLGTLAAAGVALLVAWIFDRALRPSPSEALGVGVLWLACTLAFEVVFFRLVRRRPWAELLDDWRVDRGRLWPFFLLVLALSPRLAALVR